MPRIAMLKPLSEEEKRTLIIALNEMKARGLPVPQDALDRVNRKEQVWPTDPRGYFIKKDGIAFNPTDQQAKFIASPARYSLYYGGRGSGKTASGSQKALHKIMSGESGAVINPVFSDFKDSTWKEFKEWIPWNLVVPSQRHRVNPEWQPTQPFTMVFMNGATVICKGLKNPNSARGPNINWLWYDESRNDKTGESWKTAIASVRVGNNPQIWTTTTPMGISHWLYEFFIEKDLPPEVEELLKESGQTIDDFIQTFHGSIDDNKANLDPGFYLSIISSYPSGWMRTREVEGNFAEEGGKIGDAGWFTRVREDGKNRMLDAPLPDAIRICRYWDLAATEKKQAKDDPDEAVGSLVSKHKGESYDKPLLCIQDQVAGYWEGTRLLEAIANVARHDGPLIPVVIEQEPGASGKITVAVVKDYFKKFPELQGHTVEGLDVKKVGDRVLAANLLWFSVAADGRMYMVKGSWNRETLKQIDGFTQVVHDDRVTSITNAVFKINPYKVWSKTTYVTL